MPEPFDADELMSWGSTQMNHLIEEQRITAEGIQNDECGVI